VAELILDKNMQLENLKDHLSKAQNRMKIYVDRHRTNKEYHVGQQVLLKLQPYAQSSVANHPYPKLAFKYFGTFPVTE
jgi:hypothetical protein